MLVDAADRRSAASKCSELRSIRWMCLAIGSWLPAMPGAHCRNGADPMTFGVAGTEMWGLVEVYGDLFQDLGGACRISSCSHGDGTAWPPTRSGIGETALIDRLAGISSSADAQALE